MLIACRTFKSMIIKNFVSLVVCGSINKLVLFEGLTNNGVTFTHCVDEQVYEFYYIVFFSVSYVCGVDFASHNVIHSL